MEEHRFEDIRLQVAMRPPEPHQLEKAEAGVAHAMTEGGKAPVVPYRMGLRTWYRLVLRSAVAILH